jgi:hypothetical protein
VIKAKLSNGNVILGLSKENITRLTAGHPMKFDARPLGFPGTIFIVYGETELAILHDLQEAEGQTQETRQ